MDRFAIPAGMGVRMRQTDVLIIGGGAAGLTAAIAASEGGASVTVLEHMDRTGKKLLSTGNGRCNYTNAVMSADCFRGSGLALAEDLLREYDTASTVDFFARLGIEPSERNGYFYPASGQAASVAEALRLKCAEQNVFVVCGAEIRELQHIREAGPDGKKESRFSVWYRKDGKSGQICSRTLILAAGSKAAPVTGSDGSGYGMAKQFGHRIVEVYPALTCLKTEGKFRKDWTGVRVRGSVSLYIQEKKAAFDEGELQLTDYGVSGIPVFQVSRYAAQALAENRLTEVSLCFWPERFRKNPVQCLAERLECLQQRTLEQALIGLLPAKLIPIVIRAAGLAPKESCQLRKEQLCALAEAGADFRLRVTGTGTFEQAQVCAGGVDGAEICPQTMESRCCSGLYLAGELIDVDGICGGYNLHFAWASGRRAGENAAKKAGKSNSLPVSGKRRKV